MTDEADEAGRHDGTDGVVPDGGTDDANGSDDADGVVDPEEVAHVADLARVALADDERDRFAEQFADVLAAFEGLDEVPDVERETDLANVLRPDEVRDSLHRTETLANAPETEEGHFKGPRVS